MVYATMLDIFAIGAAVVILCYLFHTIARIFESHNRCPRSDMIRLDEKRVISRRMIGRVEVRVAVNSTNPIASSTLALFIYGHDNEILEVVSNKEDRERVMEELDEGA